jgi:diguanylate cyclase (GGDEF)-like protein
VNGHHPPTPEGADTAPALAAPSDLQEHRREEQDLMVVSLIALWAVAATVFLVALLGGPPTPERARLLVLLDGLGLVGLSVVTLERHHLPRWALEVCAYACQVMVGGVVWAYGAQSGPFALFYLWFAVHAFYFLPWPRATGQLVFVAATYGAALGIGGGGEHPVVLWALTVATLAVICTMVAGLRHRVDALVARLAATAVTDPLTGLGNRRSFDELVEREFERARRAQEPLTLVLGDVDGFKAVNDRHGHPAGDDVLRRLAAVLNEGCRRPEPPMRLGGDEFAFVLVATDVAGGRTFAERIRVAVREEFAGDPRPVTISLGLATYPHHCPGLADLFRAADDAMYAAKRSGRNRTVVADSGRQLSPARP